MLSKQKSKENFMQTPVQITLRHLDHSEAVEIFIREKAEKLAHFSDHIISCHVVVELANNNQRRGNLFNTRVTVGVPGQELIATYNGDENMYNSIQDAFADVTRKLEEYRERLKNGAKHHEEPLSGKVVRMNGGGFGFIETPDGTEFYFNDAHVIAHHAKKLEIGSHVNFIALETDQGPEARRVKAAEK